MSGLFDENHLLQTLLAFVDGELDVAQTAAVLEYLVEHPQWLAVIRDQQRLRLHAHQVLHGSTPAIGDSFRERMKALGQDIAQGSDNVARAPIGGTLNLETCFEAESGTMRLTDLMPIADADFRQHAPAARSRDRSDRYLRLWNH